MVVTVKPNLRLLWNSVGYHQVTLVVLRLISIYFTPRLKKSSVFFSDSALGSGEMGRRLGTLLSSPHIVEELQPSFSNETQKKYTCSMCGYSVSRLDNFKRHMRRHTGQMHQCDVCGAQFVCKYGMQKHKEQKHGVEFMNYDDTRDSLAAMFGSK